MKKIFILLFLYAQITCSGQGSSFYKIGIDSADRSKSEDIGIWSINKTNKESEFLLIGDVNNYLSQKTGLELIFYKINENGDVILGKLLRGGKSIDVTQTNVDVNTFSSDMLLSGIRDWNYGFLLKTDSGGNFRWAKKYDSCLVKTFAVIDNYYYLAGATMDGLVKNKSYEAFVIKTDTIGKIIWSKAIGGFREDIFVHIISTFDNGIICVGESLSPENPELEGYNCYVIKMDSSGNVQWAKVYNYLNQGGTVISKIIQTLDSNFVLYVKPQKNGKFFQSLMSIDQKGNVLWAKEYYTNYNNLTFTGSALRETEDTCVVSKAYIYNSSTDIVPLLLKTNSKGDVVWHKKYMNIENNLLGYVTDFLLTKSGIITVGAAERNGYLFPMIRKSETFDTGCLQSDTIYTWTKDREVLVTDLDSVLDINIHVSDFLFEIIDINTGFQELCTITSDANISQVLKESIIFSPNPFTTTATLEINTEKAINNWQFELYNLLGVKVKTLDNINTNRFEINRQGLANGIYFYRLQQEGELLFSGKVLVSD